jgi:hypothetical protein
LIITFSDPLFWGRYEVEIDPARGGFEINREEIDLRERTRIARPPSEARELPGLSLTVSQQPEIWRRVTAVRDRDGRIIQTKRVGRRRPGRRGEPSDPAFLEDEDPNIEELKTDVRDEIIFFQRQSYEYSLLRRLIADFQAYSIYPNTLRVPQEHSNEIVLASDARNISAVMKRMRRTRDGAEAIDQITNALQSILPGLEQISILSVGGFLVPQFHMTERTGKRHKFNVAQMSDGTLRVFGLLTALYQKPRPAVIVLEEPEQTVNPAILAVLAESIKEVSRTSQVIITTHSPHLLDQFSPEQIRAVDLVAGRTIVTSVGKTQRGVVHDRLFTLGELLVSEGLHGG